jgi:hypothetical protein
MFHSVKDSSQRLMVLSAAAFVASTIPAYAGPCSQEIEHVQARVDAKLEAAAGTGPGEWNRTGGTDRAQ